MARHLALIATAALAAVLAVSVAATEIGASDRVGAATQSTLRFDVAENPKKFVFSKEHVDGQGLPAYGNYFVTQGYLYPEGTLNGNDGVKADGSPLFPNKVVGEWTCYGSHVGKGAVTKKGPWVVTTQMFQLGPKFGKTTIVTSGYEIPNQGVNITRAVIGGTGKYATSRGEQHQQLLGFGKTQGVKLRVQIDVR